MKVVVAALLGVALGCAVGADALHTIDVVRFGWRRQKQRAVLRTLGLLAAACALLVAVVAVLP